MYPSGCSIKLGTSYNFYLNIDATHACNAFPLFGENSV